ncbi:DUF2269 domain-containing protein [Ruegeria sp. ANG10]|uniref:DUF2269 family protein n=1 Tax=Ruegeria sp. ANG10 TaxID=3042467 RepID=UPI0034550B8F
MDPDLILRWLHIVGACVLLGTGAGIAFFMLIAHRSGDARFIAQTAGTVVLADLLFTATAVVLQPVTGGLLAWRLGWPMTEGWVLASLVLFAVAGVFWLPVVWIQVRLRGLAQAAAEANTPLPRTYHRLFRIWFACGFPAFASVLIIIWLMIARPSIGWI